ncbi:hypothetical protein CANCADRAFT_58741 [Tortispora caseinolytica NRRL Y-17796]|uniref:C2H2-type domain-containing protein n=1 Tax=Tortispora caseinolytica NRRL Y-17796 TaxID=767744 RepID=A0A1E4T9W8_9ASCO|nr:hypothetical protein CANCADRAFT_58741 [Tortispora caseinolytica NRRL Y-17796]
MSRSETLAHLSQYTASMSMPNLTTITGLVDEFASPKVQDGPITETSSPMPEGASLYRNMAASNNPLGTGTRAEEDASISSYNNSSRDISMSPGTDNAAAVLQKTEPQMVVTAQHHSDSSGVDVVQTSTPLHRVDDLDRSANYSSTVDSPEYLDSQQPIAGRSYFLPVGYNSQGSYTSGAGSQPYSSASPNTAPSYRNQLQKGNALDMTRDAHMDANPYSNSYFSYDSASHLNGNYGSTGNLLDYSNYNSYSRLSDAMDRNTAYASLQSPTNGSQTSALYHSHGLSQMLGSPIDPAYSWTGRDLSSSTVPMQTLSGGATYDIRPYTSYYPRSVDSRVPPRATHSSRCSSPAARLPNSIIVARNRRDSINRPLSAAGAAAKRSRRYQCEVEGCGKTFTTSGHLARHRRIHTGEKKFVCNVNGCTARFSRQDNCNQHRRTHEKHQQRRRIHDDSSETNPQLSYTFSQPTPSVGGMSFALPQLRNGARFDKQTDSALSYQGNSAGPYIN